MDRGVCVFERTPVAGAQGTSKVKIGGSLPSLPFPVSGEHREKRFQRLPGGERQLHLVTEGVREREVEDVSNLVVE